MKKLTTTILLTALIAAGTSCRKDHIGHGPVTSQTRSIPAFTGIDLRMNGIVNYTRSTSVKLEIIAPESIHSILETSVSEGKLVIRYNNGKAFDADERIQINISAPDVNTFLSNTSGSISCLSDLELANLLVRSSGSGNISFQRIITGNIDAESKMSGRITAAGGTAISEKIRTDGSGRIDLSAIAAKTVTTYIEGSGDISVKALDNLDVTIKGSGSVYFAGNPLISTHISGSGRLVRL